MTDTAIQITQADQLATLYDHRICNMDYDLGPETMAECAKIEVFGDIASCGIDVIRDNRFGSRQAWRKQQHIRLQPEDNFLLSIPEQARVRLNQRGMNTQFEAGRFSLLSTRRPFIAHISPSDSSVPSRQMIARVAGPMLREKLPTIDDYCGNPLQIKPGASRLMVSMLAMALAEGAELQDSQKHKLCDMLIDAISDAVESSLNSGKSGPCSNVTPKIKLLEQAKRYIQANLSNPNLNAAIVADHLKISTRYLRDIYTSQALSLNAEIREIRLQYCRSALRDSRLGHRPITEIALSWGFSDPAYFSRVYSARFGMSPREDRKIAAQSSKA